MTDPLKPQCCGFGCTCEPIPYEPDDTQPIQLVICEHTDSPWCPRCAGGLQ